MIACALLTLPLPVHITTSRRTSYWDKWGATILDANNSKLWIVRAQLFSHVFILHANNSTTSMILNHHSSALLSRFYTIVQIQQMIKHYINDCMTLYHIRTVIINSDVFMQLYKFNKWSNIKQMIAWRCTTYVQLLLHTYSLRMCTLLSAGTLTSRPVDITRLRQWFTWM